ncbi:glutamine--fructose-6-phosphate transaminase (isomerizing) [Parvularcula lutaonensis]|uniref:Glutamine--fructose-6-phosphate aminotransferase [isomerizing] n=1 Tax=Parvularcula lutaonensis TaxID=491923 RepID=A0ABV7MAX1_9PROT|nr:glutamine--fructose-6-phosphate transaminase (isomerizing) [Parvularcula lutaonensis]GGY38849.1 glutamine--fructose-6-phosphate aminotransferase [isomerizing] [Parvularcula lutaonensis]
MCGIVGIVSEHAVASRLVEGLRRLEYRGYDSAGIATVLDGKVHRRRAVGKLRALEDVLEKEPLAGHTGIGHTRWATHGRPTVSNAHPHGSEKVAVVHNGIIENFSELKEDLVAKGVSFESETDTEVVARLIEWELSRLEDPQAAFSSALKALEGAFALGVIFASQPQTLYCARRGSPLAIGRGEGEMYIGSDALALAPFTRRVTYLEEGDWAVLGLSGAVIYSAGGTRVERKETLSDASAALVGKGRHRHFMAKEIEEQAEVVSHALATYLLPAEGKIELPEGGIDFSKVSRLTISACGTAFYAGLIAKYWLESWARLPVEIDIASELRYRDVPYQKGDSALFISQSGETADTLAAMRHAKASGVKVGAILNVVESSMARDADAIYPIKAGPEIGVASTKAFTCQLATLACIAIAAGRQRGHLTEADEKRLVHELLKIPRLMADVSSKERDLEQLALDLVPASDVIYLGRGVSFPLALEGALKLKEISYIHAEGYAAGELKHGPIALIDEHVPVVVIAPDDQHFEKTVSNMHEVIARGGKCILLSTSEGLEKARADDELLGSFAMPSVEPMLAPLVYAVPIQLLAYYTAVHKGTDVDQPRNLAKSVTVE